MREIRKTSIQHHSANALSGYITIPKWCHLGTFTADDQASIDVVDILGADFLEVKIVLKGIAPVDNGVNLQIALSNNNGSSWYTGSVYESGGHVLEMASTPDHIDWNEANDQIFQLTNDGVGNATSENVSGVISAFGWENRSGTGSSKALWTFHLAYANSVPNWKMVNGLLHSDIGLDDETNAMQFTFETGNVASGSVSLYGLGTGKDTE